MNVSERRVAHARSRRPRFCLVAIVVLGIAAGLLREGITSVRAAGSVTISSVTGTFYPNPGDSGAFDAAQLAHAVFTQQFPLVDFNPTSGAQTFCSNATGINENTRPFTEVVPNPDGTCSTLAASGKRGAGGRQ